MFIYFVLSLAFLLYFLLEKQKIKKYKKYSIVAKVINCTEVGEENINTENQTKIPMYEIIYQYRDKDGIKRKLKETSKKKIDIDTEINGYLIKKKDVHIIKRPYEVKQKYSWLSLLFSALMLTMGIICLYYQHKGTTFVQLLPFLVSSTAASICLLIGGVMLFIYIKNKKMLNNSDLIKEYSAKLVDYSIKKVRMNDRWTIVFSPIYEFYNNGNKQYYISSIFSNIKKPIGTTTVVYENRETRKIFEKEDTRLYLILAIIFGGLGTVSLIIFLLISFLKGV